MSRSKLRSVIPARDRELVDKLYQCLVRECGNPLYALKILRLARRRVISDRNAGRYDMR
ncbi:hypothetical protein ES703_108306 [subsurface metagenome]